MTDYKITEYWIKIELEKKVADYKPSDRELKIKEYYESRQWGRVLPERVITTADYEPQNYFSDSEDY